MNCFKNSGQDEKLQVSSLKSQVSSYKMAFFFCTLFALRSLLYALRCLLFALLCPLSSILYAETVIKFATLAPEGSAWMKVMNQFNAEAVKKTEGRVRFKIYAGGVAGDEKDVIKKIRIGQLHAGGFTGVGIGEIAPEIRILDTPFLVKNTRELDYIYEKFDGEFRRAFKKNGFMFLGWAEVGKVYIFSNTAVSKPADLKNVKMWLWEGDPIAEETFRAAEIKPIPLSITDVMTSIETGMINGVYASPLSVIALQWFTKMKYVLSEPIANAAGAVLVSEKNFNKLDKKDREILLSLGRECFKNLTLISRTDKLLPPLQKR
ncbi:MAG: TRAP transporter substrate-binding protein DctP [Elusimicrobia bacterium]|nr:TRAP transporter substrate-binding protein DctP [Elusimicrobiota bacterium]